MMLQWQISNGGFSREGELRLSSGRKLPLPGAGMERAGKDLPSGLEPEGLVPCPLHLGLTKQAGNLHKKPHYLQGF
jgi:hypothetical protein